MKKSKQSYCFGDGGHMKAYVSSAREQVMNGDVTFSITLPVNLF